MVLTLDVHLSNLPSEHNLPLAGLRFTSHSLLKHNCGIKNPVMGGIVLNAI